MAASAGVTCHANTPRQGRSVASHGYDLSLNRTQELVHEEVEHRPPLESLAELRKIEQEILQGIDEL
jgi:type I restriction enzyme M protein